MNMLPVLNFENYDWARVLEASGQERLKGGKVEGVGVVRISLDWEHLP